MMPEAHELAGLAWDQFWQVTIVAVAVALLVRLFSRRRPQLAYVLWLLVIVKCLTPPIFSSPTGAFGWAKFRAIEPPAQETLDHTVTGAAPARPLVVAEEPLPHAETTHVSSEPVAEPAGPTTRLFILWLCGAAICATVVVAKRVSWSLRLRRGRLEVDGSLAALTADLSRRLGVKRKVRLLVTTQPLSPGVYGPIRPTLVLPEPLLTEESAGQLEGIVAHELIHVRRGDPLVGMLQLVAGILWWFHPLVWWVNRQACRQRELCCDEEVIAGLGCDPGRYAQGLLDVLKLNRQSCPLFAFSGIRPVEVTARRLENIMRGGNTFHRRTPRWCWGIGIVAAALVLPGQAMLVSSEPGASSLAAEETHQAPPTEENTAADKKIRDESPSGSNAPGKAKSTDQQTKLDIYALSFAFPPRILTPERLSREDLSRHGTLTLVGEQIKDTELVSLKRLPRLRQLHLSQTAITPKGLVHLKDLPNLDSLNFYGPDVTDDWLLQIKDLTGLQSLHLLGTGITDAGLVHLKSLTSLSSLHIIDAEIGDAGLAHLKNMTHMRFLTLRRVQVTDAGLKHVSRLKKLWWFSLGSPNVRGEGLVHLLELKSLHQLQFTGSDATNEWLRHVEPLRSVEWLALGGTNVTGAGLSHIAKWTELEDLYLNRNPIGDDGLVHLEKLPALDKLEMRETRVTGKGIEKLRRILADTTISHESIADRVVNQP